MKKDTKSLLLSIAVVTILMLTGGEFAYVMAGLVVLSEVVNRIIIPAYEEHGARLDRNKLGFVQVSIWTVALAGTAAYLNEDPSAFALLIPLVVFVLIYLIARHRER